jgi:ribokinase
VGSSATKRYCVLGSVNMDMVTRVAAFPKPGETVEGKSFATFTGGKGANQAVALARLGARVRMAGRVGDDLFGARYLRVFEAEGVDSSSIETVRGASTGTASIDVSDSGENRIIIVAGANALVDAPFVEARRSAIETSEFLLLQLEIPLESVMAAARMARRAGRTVILDPAPAKPLPAELLSSTSIITPNETEAAVLTGEDTRDEQGIRKAGEQLILAGVDAAIVKAGERGAYLCTRGRFEHVPGFMVRSVDTTAAGDSFNAGLALALGEGRNMVEAIRFANAVAAISTTRDGAQPAMPLRAEVEAFMAAGSGT